MVSAPALDPESSVSTANVARQAVPAAQSGVSASMGDGGFGQRLSAAQHAQQLPGLPGSDTRLAPGLQMIDPRRQGIGGLMRKTQRLFGVTSKPCIDVEAWSRMSIGELLARHLSPADVEAANQKYDCNRPLGLNL